MNYTEVIIKMSPALNHKTELLIAVMAEIGYEGFLEEKNELRAYIPADDFSPDKLYKLPIIGNNKEGLKISHRLLKETNWNALWESNFEPVTIDDCIVRAPFHQKPPDITYDILIEPKMAFGTGHHETTSMMLQFMLQTNFTDKTVLDMGCGTAVLAILACMKSATYTDAVDNDPRAYNNAIENCLKNNIKNCNVMLGGLEQTENKFYDIILANITRNALLDMIPSFSKMQKEKGQLFLSGFLVQDIDFMTDFAAQYNYDMKSRQTKNNWAALELYKKQ